MENETVTKRNIFQRIKDKGIVRRLNILLALVLLLFVGYTLFGPIVPAKYDKPSLVTQQVVSGGTLTYKMKSCRYVGEAVVTTVTRKLVSTTDPELAPIVLSVDTVTNPSRCIEPKRTLLVPLSTPEGNYQLVVTGVYQVIPLRQPITVQAKTDSFYIKASETNLDVQSLLETNQRLQQQLDAQNGQSAPVQGGGSGGSTSSSSSRSSTSTTPNSNGGSTTTNNNTTTNNTTNNNATPGEGSGEDRPGLIQSILNNLPLGL